MAKGLCAVPHAAHGFLPHAPSNCARKQLPTAHTNASNAPQASRNARAVLPENQALIQFQIKEKERHVSRKDAKKSNLSFFAPLREIRSSLYFTKNSN